MRSFSPTKLPPSVPYIPIIIVESDGIAHRADLQPGDLLLRYNGTVLGSPADLKPVPSGTDARRIPVQFCRNGEVRTIEVVVGDLGIEIDPNRAAQRTVRALVDNMIFNSKVNKPVPLHRLAGTRREIEAIAALFPKEQVATLLGEQATESAVQKLAESGQLKTFRYIHLATHGKADRTIAMNSALFLVPDADHAVDPLRPETDGRITAQQIVNTWDLDADLVVHSACETGLGSYAIGEGYLGFSQALFVKGTRSVVLSLCSVNDQSTQLLMKRFYENLLGRRTGLTSPMRKADALDEAKQWLRSLTVYQVADLTRSNPRPANPAAAKEAMLRSYDHPYFWAGFILIGDPN